jgi:uncharacterized membrane protein
MDESPTDRKGKARKISIKVEEQPVQEPIAPVPQAIVPDRKKILWSYFYMGIGVALVVVSSFDLYTPSLLGQASMMLLIVGGLWLAYGIFSYIRAKG